MTTYAEAYEAIAARICDTSRFVGALVALENQDFKAPTDEPWVRLSVRHFDAEQETLGRPGNRQFLRAGSVIVQVFVPYGLGVYRAQQLAQQVRDLYEGEALPVLGSDTERLRFFAGSTIEIGQTDGFYQVNVELPFDYNEQK